MKPSHQRLLTSSRAAQRRLSHPFGALDQPFDDLDQSFSDLAASDTFERPAPPAPCNDNNAADKGWQSILVWVGCPQAAERACELAVELSRVSAADITFGIPGTVDLQELQQLVMPLSDSGIDVRVRMLADRSTLSLLDEVRRNGHDLVIHADERSPNTPSPQLLSRVFPCPIWTVRSLPSKRAVPSPGCTAPSLTPGPGAVQPLEASA